MGLTCLDHFQPGSNLARPTVAPPILTTSILPFSNFRTSSGELRCFTSILDEGMISPLGFRIIRLLPSPSIPCKVEPRHYSGKKVLKSLLVQVVAGGSRL